MKTYKIIAKTNSYIARRDGMFAGKCEVTLDSGLSLKEAHRILLNMYNDSYNSSVPNWGAAVFHSRNSAFGAVPTFNDGTRCYSYDSRSFFIEEEDEE